MHKQYVAKAPVALRIAAAMRARMLAYTQEQLVPALQNANANAKVYADDVAYAAKALAAFEKKWEANNLHTALQKQDTVVREHYTEVLQIIEQEGLAAYNAVT